MGLLFFSCRKDPALTDDTFHLNVPGNFPTPFFPEGLTKEKFVLGKKLFSDKNLSLNKTISCASCHNPNNAFSDNISLSMGLHGKSTLRNAAPLFNLVYQKNFSRDGGVPRLELQVLSPILDSAEMGMNVEELVKRLGGSKEYRDLFTDAYNSPPDVKGLSHALSTYLRTLISGNSHYDKVMQGKENFTDEERKGKDLFEGKAGCVNCHSGFRFSNGEFYNTGLYEEYKDKGVGRITGKKEDIGKFKVPSLRNLGYTAPYMHDGSLVNLEDVIEHYDKGGWYHQNKSVLIKSLNLSSEEKKQLIAFLSALNDPSFLKDN